MELKAFLPEAWEQFKQLFAKYVRKTFVGTRAEWNQLPLSERIKYDIADLEDDYDKEPPTSLVLQTTAEARRGQSGTPGATELAYTYTAEQRSLFTCSWYIANSSESTLIYSSFIAKINGIPVAHSGSSGLYITRGFTFPVNTGDVVTLETRQDTETLGVINIKVFRQ